MKTTQKTTRETNVGKDARTVERIVPKQLHVGPVANNAILNGVADFQGLPHLGCLRAKHNVLYSDKKLKNVNYMRYCCVHKGTG